MIPARVGAAPLDLAAVALALAGLLWTSRAFDRLARDPFGGAWAFAVLAGVAALLASRGARVRALLRAGWPLLLPVALAAVSALWSLDPPSTLRQAAGLASTTGFGVWLAARFDPPRQLALAALAGAALVATALVVVVLRPDVGIMTGLHEGAWQGPFWTRNRLAPVACLALVACALAGAAQPRARAFAWAGVALATGVLLGSRSRTAGLVLAACALAWLFAAGIRRAAPARRPWIAGGALALGLALGALGWRHADAVLAPLGRDATISDRTRIWSLALDAAAARPWLGAGYRAFWRRAPEASRIAEELRFQPFHAHNGLVELGLELGLVGVLAAAVPFAVFAARAAQRAVASASAADAWPWLYLVLFAVWNAVEPLAWRPAHCFTVLYAAAALTASDPAARTGDENLRAPKPRNR